MAKKRLTIGARVRHKKNGASDGVIRSSLGRGKWMIKWSDKEAEEEVNSRSLFTFKKSKKSLLLHQAMMTTVRREMLRLVRVTTSMHGKAKSSIHSPLAWSGMK